MTVQSQTTRTGRDDLVAATRELMLAVGLAGLPDADLADAADRVRALVPHLRTRTLEQVPAPTYEESVGGDGYFAARANPGLVPVDMGFADGRGWAQVTLDDLHQGPKGSVHGGIISYLMDTLLASLVQQQGHLCVTASLSVDYRARTPLHEPLELAAWVAEERRRSLLVKGTISHAGQVTVEAQGLFVAVPER